MKRGRYYEKGSVLCLCAGTSYNDKELLYSARYFSDRWSLIVCCCQPIARHLKRIAHTRMLCFVLIVYVSLNGRKSSLKYPWTEKIRDTRCLFGYKANPELEKIFVHSDKGGV